MQESETTEPTLPPRYRDRAREVDEAVKANPGVALTDLDVTKPMRTDPSAFAAWLRLQRKRKDRVGSFSRVCYEDPFWPGGDDRVLLREHFKLLSARSWVVESLNIALREFDAEQKRKGNRQKNKAARRARKRNRH